LRPIKEGEYADGGEVKPTYVIAVNEIKDWDKSWIEHYANDYEEAQELRDYAVGLRPIKEGEYADGGVVDFKYDPNIDYLSEYHLLPKNVYDLLMSIEQDEFTWDESKEILKKLEPMGWTFEYGMDGGWYSLRPIGEPEQEFKNGGEIHHDQYNQESHYLVIIDDDYDSPLYFKDFNSAKKYVLANVKKQDNTIMSPQGDSIEVEKNQSQKDLDWLFSMRLENGGTVEDYDVDEVLKHFVMAMLWASTDDEGEPLEDNYSQEDVGKDSVKDIKKGIVEFIKENHSILKHHNITEESLGHDLFLDSQGHGVGFWDRGYGEEGDILSVSAKKYFASDSPYVGDDGDIYLQFYTKDKEAFANGGETSNASDLEKRLKVAKVLAKKNPIMKVRVKVIEKMIAEAKNNKTVVDKKLTVEESIEKAYEIGVKDYHDKNRQWVKAPAQSVELVNLITHLNIPISDGGSVEIMKAWNKARQDENDKEMKRDFPEMYKPKSIVNTINELKGKYEFASPYHDDKRPLPFNIVGYSGNDDYPVSVDTVEYRGYTESKHNGSYSLDVIKDYIKSKFIQPKGIFKAQVKKDYYAQAQELADMITEELKTKSSLASHWDLHKNSNEIKAIPLKTKNQKYIKINMGTSGKFMVDVSNGAIYGIKGYGKINKDHKYGNIEDYLSGKRKIQPQNTYSPLERTSTVEPIKEAVVEKEVVKDGKSELNAQLKPFVLLARKTNDVDEFMSKTREIKGVTPELAKHWREKYQDSPSDSIYDVAKNFFKEVKFGASGKYD
jgi:hypothetical protein